ncbi:hypothetical protein ACFLYL_01090 [Chloroflexota bacterium]
MQYGFPDRNMIIAAKRVSGENGKSIEEVVKKGLIDNWCRHTGFTKIV